MADKIFPSGTPETPLGSDIIPFADVSAGGEFKESYISSLPISTATQTALDAKQGELTLTTTGTSGPATLIGDTLNIPQYTGGGGGAVDSVNGQTGVVVLDAGDVGAVPYTGATGDLDLGAFKLNAQSLHVKGTGGAGHLGLKHQSATISASASESSLGADSSGNPVWKNDGNALQNIVLEGGPLGTPSSGVATNLTGTAPGLTAGNVTTNANLTGAITSVGNATSLGAFTTSQLNTALSDNDIATGGGTATGTNTGDVTLVGTPSYITIAGQVITRALINLASHITGTLPVANGGTGVTTSTGTGNVVLSTSPTLTTPLLGTPTSGNLTNCTGLPVSSGVSGLGTGVATALAVNVGTAGAPVINGGALGTPSSGTLTNATGLPVSGITSSTSTALGVGSLELGHASDTTLSRSSAGVLAVEGVVVPTISSTNTITNKRIQKRVVTTTQSATPSINTDNGDIFQITGLAQAITSMTSGLTGTPVNGELIAIQITDNGTARAITWGTSFEASTVALPTTTVISTRLDILFIWNSVTSKWRCIAVA